MSSVTTCDTCPLATQIEGKRYRCEATHKIGLEVVRGNWKATADCYDAITIQQHQASVDFADGRLQGWRDAKNKSNSIAPNASDNWIDGYWQGFSEYLNTVISITAAKN